MGTGALSRFAGPVALLGGVLWLLVWLLYMLTHGTGQEDEQGRLLGLTHYDYSKLIVIPLATFAVGLDALHARQRRRAGRLGTVGFGLTIVSLGLAAVGVVLALWPLAWGTYGVDWEAPLPMVGGVIMSLSTLALVVGMVAFGIATWRADIWPTWVAIALVVGPLTVVPWLHMTIYGWIFGALWIALGIALWSVERSGQSQPRHEAIP